METVAKGPVLSDSIAKSRPNTFLFYRNDDTDEFKKEVQRRVPTMNMSIAEWKEKRFAYEEKEDNTAALKWREAMIQKAKENVTDPLSGCMSQAYDQPRQENKCLIKSFTLKSLDPPHVHPKELAARKLDSAELCNADESWNSKHVAGSTTAKFGGWTSAVDPRLTGEVRWGKSQAFPTFGKVPVPDEQKTPQEKTAVKYIYTSTTQRAYQDVPFDRLLAPRRPPPPPTPAGLEGCADPVRQKGRPSRYDAPTETWKELPEHAPGWDWEQKRYDFYSLPRQHDYCSDRPRGHQIPSYSGFIASYKPEHLDNPYVVPYEPMNLVRTQVPKYSYTSHDNVKLPALNRTPPLGPTTLSPPYATDFMQGLRHERSAMCKE